MRRVQPIFLLANLSKILKHIHQQQHVCGHIQVMIICKILATKCHPDLFRVRILLLCYAFAAKTQVELFFFRELGFVKPFKRVHVLVQLDAFLQQQPLLVFF